jgi:hypothetical protein
MNKQPNPKKSDLTLFQFMLRAQQIAQQEQGTEKGYAMMITSLLSIVLFSLLAAYMTMTNLSKASTNAYVDGTNTFYAAESGLNKRAQELRERFSLSILPSSVAAPPADVSACFAITMADYRNASASNSNNDFECRNYRFQHTNNSAIVKSLGNEKAMGGSVEVTNQNDLVNYIVYTFVKPKQDYAVTPPTPQRIVSGEPFAGLNALDYTYTVSATAKKLNLITAGLSQAEIDAKKREANNVTIAGDTALIATANAKQIPADARNSALGVENNNHKTVLQMDFKSRVVPLFQFAAFYEDDLEMTSQMPMTITGPIHTNSNLRAISYGYNNGGDASHNTSASVVSADLLAGTRLLGKVTAVSSIYERVRSDEWRPNPVCSTGGNLSNQTTNCGVLSVYKGSGSNTDAANFSYFPDFNLGSTTNRTRTTPLTTSELSVFGDRMLDGSGGVTRLNPPKPGFLREQNYTTNQYGTYYQKADIRIKFFPNRLMPFDFTPIKSGSGCSIVTMNIPVDRQNSSALSCNPLTKGQLRSLQQPVLINLPAGMTAPNENSIKALQIAIASSPTLITLTELGTEAISSSTKTWAVNFRALLSSNSLTAANSGQTANQILATRAAGSSFLPPPIQLVKGNSNAGDDNTNGGFYNQLKDVNGNANGKWMTMLQTNIRSLTYWNRYNVYVEPTVDPTDLTTAYVTPTLTLSSVLSTDHLAFMRAAPSGTVVGSFPMLGLAAADRTEGGLVVHATVDDTNAGIAVATGSTIGTDLVPAKDANGVPITDITKLDKYRKYGGTQGKSPYGFVVSGGEELPGPLTFATDQAAYIQGDYNNPGIAAGTILPDRPYRPSNSDLTVTYTPSNSTTSVTAPNLEGFYRQPASIIADTITVLSNECKNNNKYVGRVDTVKCGVFGTAIGSAQAKVQKGIAINAAFLSNLMKSGATAGTSNGGLNKYMRLLENWYELTGGVNLSTHYNYTGSMVSLGEPLESDKVPEGSGVPRRNFNYETRFDAFEKLPPLAPSAVYLKQDVFKRKY